MLSEESIWIRNIIKENFSDDDFPLLNIGSSTEEFRKKTQPDIYSNVFAPLIKAKKKVFHTDIKDEIGVDLVGDLNEELFRNHLKSLSKPTLLRLLQRSFDPSRLRPAKRRFRMACVNAGYHTNGTAAGGLHRASC